MKIPYPNETASPSAASTLARKSVSPTLPSDTAPVTVASCGRKSAVAIAKPTTSQSISGSGLPMYSSKSTRARDENQVKNTDVAAPTAATLTRTTLLASLMVKIYRVLLRGFVKSARRSITSVSRRSLIGSDPPRCAQVRSPTVRVRERHDAHGRNLKQVYSTKRGR